MNIEDKIALVVERKNEEFLQKITNQFNDSISKIKRVYADCFMPDYVPVRKATEVLGISRSELLKRLHAINTEPKKVGTRHCITRDELLTLMN